MREPRDGAEPESFRASVITESQWRQVADTLPQLMWTFDRRGELLWANKRWVELTGLSEAEALRRESGLALVHPEDQPELRQQWARALETLVPCEMEYRIRTRDGSYRWHLTRATPMRDEEGCVTGWAAAAFDIHDRREAEALRASERRFQAVFDSNPHPTTITRLSDGTFLNVNDAFLHISGFTREEVLGRTPVDLGIWTAEQREQIVAHLRAWPAGEKEVSFRSKGGRSMVLALTSTRIDFGGEPCMMTSGTDVTERHAAEAELRDSEARARARADELAALMEAVPAVVWFADDPRCEHVRANRAGYEILRIASGENLSKSAPDARATNHFQVFVKGVKLSPDQLPLQRAATGIELRNYEEELHFEDGEVKHLYGNVVPLRDPSGEPRGAIGALVDVTRLKQAEAAMREADRRKDEFLAILSHELRNPLAPIITAAQLMRLKGDVPAPDELEVILRQAQHLVGLVDDLLDVSRVARGKVTLSRNTQEVADIVAKAVEATAALLEERRQRLSLSVPAQGLLVSADSMRLTQVFSNLLTNAARYTPPGGEVRVTASREGDEVVLRFRDSGVGIAPALLPHVFEMFVQGEQGPERPGGGLGLGLSLVRTLTLLHGGTVSAHSDGPGRGSEFTVRLPAASPATVRTRTPPPKASPRRVAKAHVQRVLVVDDNRDAASMISYLLTDAGHEVLVANDPFQALLAADAFRPQVAILDIGLPVMDGYALGKELRKRLAGSAPILIALTGYGQEQDRRRSEEAGFAFHLVKPFGAEKLVHLLREVAERDGGRASSVKIEERP